MTSDDLDIEKLDAEELVDVDEKAEPVPLPQPISYYGADFDVIGLVRRLRSGDIVIPTFDPSTEVGADLAGFQRRFVWRKYQMDRFVESLLLEYPVPGIFLVQQADKKLLVLDGQQRLRTLVAFYRGTIDEDTTFKLESVGTEFVGLMYDGLDEQKRRTLDNTFIRATIVKYDASAGGDEAVYQVFERLNTGGTNLYPHEIRVALYSGHLANLLRELNEQESWRNLFGKKSERLKDQELILRFVALHTDATAYKRPLKTFLNNFMRDHRALQNLDAAYLRTLFSDSCTAVAKGIGPRAFRLKSQINAALIDSVLCGVAHRVAKGPLSEPAALATAFDALLKEDAFQIAVARATASEDSVEHRLRLSREAFGKVP